jgi:hypothetical protein
LLAAKGESTGTLAALSLREAANLAIWGEPSTPPGEHSTEENRSSDRDEPLSPQTIDHPLVPQTIDHPSRGTDFTMISGPWGSEDVRRKAPKVH